MYDPGASGQGRRNGDFGEGSFHMMESLLGSGSSVSGILYKLELHVVARAARRMSLAKPCRPYRRFLSVRKNNRILSAHSYGRSWAVHHIGPVSSISARS